MLVPGGGGTADAVRHLDRLHGLGEERSHWLALHALALNARFLAALLPGAAVVEDAGAWAGLEVLDAHAFARADEGRPGALPHCWAVTSDSVAARAAVVSGAHGLVLLKSTDLPQGIGWDEAGRRGLVDRNFPDVVAAGGVAVRWVNLRAAAC